MRSMDDLTPAERQANNTRFEADLPNMEAVREKPLDLIFAQLTHRGNGFGSF